MKGNIHSTHMYISINLSNKYLLSTYYVVDALPGADDTVTKKKDTTNWGICLRQNVVMSVPFLNPSLSSLPLR